MQNEEHKEECYKNRCKSRIHFFLPICCTILITLLSSCNTQSTKTSALESLTRNTPPNTLKQFGTVKGTSFCRNCIEDKIVFDEEYTREQRDILFESILTGSGIGYDLHSESDCPSSE